MNFLLEFPADIPDPYAEMLTDQKASPQPPGLQENTLFGADSHDFWCGRP